ncbi:hypothetical protein BB561_004464 [Smittium simulii]|uniref:Reverse transcriptase domain-containing protein n=1 Tax=Smittium simulii TaxID=133385 RepID=A0A2T9YG49_9FUNG|nr:hypothetical protein BB561_004464 [Smittium simulii]
MCVRIGSQVSQLPGVSIPGLATKIHGLLFADDAVVVTETSDGLKSTLNIITKWADMSEMQINNSKCAIRFKVLQSVLILSGTYGGELFVMGEKRNSPIQKALAQVLRLIAGVGKNTALNRHRSEFDDLTKNPIKAGVSTWVSDRYDKNDKSKIYIFIKTHNMETTSKIRTVLYWTCEKLDKLKFIQNMLLQGCPLSPMLFYMYINNIFDGVDGVYVPGLGKWIPGLLFADNDVVLAELSISYK